MRLIERYLFRQLLGPFLLAASALAAVALLSQSLGALDLVVTQGQSALVLFKISMLTMPQLVVLILPIALFVGGLVALNRLHTEQEIVVCFASGTSTWRVISPAIKLAVLSTLLSLLINLWAEPWSERTLRDELFRIRTDLAASLIHVGQFNQPAAGLTVYAQDVDQSGVFHNLFLYREQPTGGDITFLAAQGKVTKRNGAPVLLMHDGSEQQFSSAGVLNYLKFDDYTFDLSSFMTPEKVIHYKPSDRYLHELLFPDMQQRWEQHNRVKLLSEANARLATPLYNLAFMIMALAAVIGGPFSRLGYGRRIVAVSAAAGVARILGFGAQAACDVNAWFNVVQYLIPLGAAFWASAVLFRRGAGRAAALRPLRASRVLFGTPA
jgi:lipopolysaccharide export system permease protein